MYFVLVAVFLLILAHQHCLAACLLSTTTTTRSFLLHSLSPLPRSARTTRLPKPFASKKQESGRRVSRTPFLLSTNDKERGGRSKREILLAAFQHHGCKFSHYTTSQPAAYGLSTTCHDQVSALVGSQTSALIVPLYSKKARTVLFAPSGLGWSLAQFLCLSSFFVRQLMSKDHMQIPPPAAVSQLLPPSNIIGFAF
jgi:hypothetical protein